MRDAENYPFALISRIALIYIEMSNNFLAIIIEHSPRFQPPWVRNANPQRYVTIRSPRLKPWAMFLNSKRKRN